MSHTWLLLWRNPRSSGRAGPQTEIFHTVLRLAGKEIPQLGLETVGIHQGFRDWGDTLNRASIMCKCMEVCNRRACLENSLGFFLIEEGTQELYRTRSGLEQNQS